MNTLECNSPFQIRWLTSIAFLVFQSTSPQLAQAEVLPPLKDSEPQVFRLKLTDRSGVSEWVRVEVNGQRVKVLHSTVMPSGLSQILSLTGMPVPIGHTWFDHPTTAISFQPERCKDTSCTLIGIDSLELPLGTDVSRGEFTVQYIESDVKRSVSFNVPSPVIDRKSVV